ncbi:hypothetical protein QCA50_007717 [Cerrena zonata]|uniref:Uncharacterized protein n=1 Tax=Cerrena zonata TaxID=2478898 RepID=A0AAW0GHW1_9APHY
MFTSPSLPELSTRLEQVTIYISADSSTFTQPLNVIASFAYAQHGVCTKDTWFAIRLDHNTRDKKRDHMVNRLDSKFWISARRCRGMHCDLVSEYDR